ncbi:MAG: S-adenosylmethionine:tRNA ribosyltransferase-isomerase, partial [Actinobacteria bacterium]|nr:S-adenosylmethionine:tRNA ribosyltransferase-isomerase [Actinomycetota bacterium]
MTAALAALAAPAAPADVDGDPTGAVAFDTGLPPELQAHEPPESRGSSRADVRLMVSRTTAREVSHHAFAELPDLLLPGDLLVVNNSATLPAAVPVAVP